MNSLGKMSSETSTEQKSTAAAASRNPTACSLFGASTPSATNPTTKSSTSSPSTNHDHKSIATIPSYNTKYPRLLIQSLVESALLRYKNFNSNGGGGSRFASQELIQLLNTSTTTKSGRKGMDGEEIGEGPVGSYLCNPTSIITTLSTCPPTNPPEFRKKLLQMASHYTNPSHTTTTQSNNASPSNEGYVILNNQLTIITPQIAKDVLTISKCLYIDEMDAICLYAESRRIICNSGGDVDRNNHSVEGSSEERRVMRSEFVNLLIKGGKVGYSETRKQKEEIYERAGQPSPSKRNKKESSATTVAVQTAQNIYFTERSALLSTISDLIKHRIEIADVLSSSSSINGNSSEDTILIATDQLLKSGLISNLIQNVKELTGKINDIRNLILVKKKQSASSCGGRNTEQPQTVEFFGTPSTAPPLTDMDYALLGFTQLQRQVTVESLYFISYHTQLSVDEVCSLIDLIQDLTNGKEGTEGLPILDPLIEDVPCPYENVGGNIAVVGEVGSNALLGDSSAWQQQQQGHNPFGLALNQKQSQQEIMFAPLQPKLKDPKAWQSELVTSLWKRGQPQLLQCTSTLIMSVICAFDAKHKLVNRVTHGINSFGIGNALFPPTNGSAADVALLSSLNQRLDPNSNNIEKSWKRKDIWGLLLVPYALLLRNAASQMLICGSPVQSGCGSSGSSAGDIKSTYSKCLMVASQLKALTFARFSLLPSLSCLSFTPPSSSSASSGSSSTEFYLSTLSELTAQYIDALGTSGNFPITRLEWYDEEVNLAQSEWMEKEQRRQFGEWAGQQQDSEPDNEEIFGPRKVNIMDRPDCLEDVFGLVSGIVEVHPIGAQCFWYISDAQQQLGRDEELSAMTLSPSRALQTLDLLQSENDSTLYVYLSFLASISLANGVTDGVSGADMVHSYLTGTSVISSHGGDRRMHFVWNTIIDSIRWYAEHLSPDEAAAEEEESSTIRRPNPENEIPTSYYYGVRGAGGNYASSPSFSFTQGNYNISNTNTAPKKKELDEVGRNTLMALLCLISNVSSKCDNACEFILAIQLPTLGTGNRSPSGSSSGSVLQDGSLEILFSLLTVTTLPPDIMGMAFTAIANLLHYPATSATTSARRAWELLEMCQLIPIKLLSQYSSFAAGAGRTSSLISKKQSSSTNGLTNTFPESTDYGMIYKFEHVETPLGSFRATEGFLYLLSTLIKGAGCPSNLGSQWRLRTGCGPYIDYVTDFILPRATAMDKNIQEIKFENVSEECRLVERALEVVEAVLVRYVVPYQDANITTMDMGLSSSFFVDAENISEEELDCSIQDFRNVLLPTQGITPSNGNQMLEASFSNKIPLPKSPGFTILASLLSKDKSILFQTIEKLLSVSGSSVSSIFEYAESIHSIALAKSLFREIPPTVKDSSVGAITKARFDHHLTSNKTFQAMLMDIQEGMICPLNPLLILSYSESSSDHNASSSNALLWKERILLLSLRILCVAAAREKPFIDSLAKATKGLAPLSIVPSLFFKGPIHCSNGHQFVQKLKVNVTRISLLLAEGSSSLPVITEYVGYESTALSDSQSIANAAFNIVSYITKTLPHALCGKDDTFGVRLGNAFARGLSRMPESSTNIQNDILALILNKISAPSAYKSTNLDLAFMMLGLSGDSSRHNSLDVVLDLIADRSFVLDPKTSSTATKCFELLHHVCEMASDKTLPVNVQSQLLCLTKKLRRTKFWQTQVLHYLGMQGPSTQSILHEISTSFSLEYGDDAEISGRNNDVLHSISSLLKCVTIELYSFIGQLGKHSSVITIMPTSGEAHHHLQSLLACLLNQTSSLLLSSLIDMPLGQTSNSFIEERLQGISAPSSDALKESSRLLQGSTEVCSGYEIIEIERLLSHYQDIGSEQYPENSTTQNANREWAKAWNSFVYRVCACANISQTWSELVRAVLLCSSLINDNVTVPPQANSLPLQLNTRRTVTDLLYSILSRLLNPSHLDALGHYTVQHTEHNASLAGNIESECAMPMSVAALSLIDILIGANYGQDIVEEDVTRLCCLIVGALSSCSESNGINGYSLNDRRGALLSYALTKVMVFCQDVGYSIFSQNTPAIWEVYVNTISYLFQLSTYPVFNESERYANAHQAMNGVTALAARSGLVSLLCYLNSIDSGLFCSKIFNVVSIPSKIAQLVRLLSSDSDVAILLEQIALFKEGAQMLGRVGITTKLLDCAKSFNEEESKYLSSHLGANEEHLLSPSTLFGHLSLINGLLASPLSTSDQVALAVDSYELLKIYSSTSDQLFRVYPRKGGLTNKFIETLLLTYTTLLKDTRSSSNMFGSAMSNIDDSVSVLERSVLRIVSTLSEYPLSTSSPLPTRLLNVDQIHSSRIKIISTTNQSGASSTTSWWDFVPVTAQKEQPLLNHSAWSERNCQYALLASQCLDTALSFLISRVSVASKRDLSPRLSIDAVAIAKGICRCHDASRTIQDFFTRHPENEIAMLLNNNPLKDQAISSLMNISSQLKLATSLERCSEKLVSLALQDARWMSTMSTTPETAQLWAYFVAALTPALDHIERGSESSKMLRQEMDKMN